MRRHANGTVEHALGLLDFVALHVVGQVVSPENHRTLQSVVARVVVSASTTRTNKKEIDQHILAGLQGLFEQ
jgi:hypothetical protein